MVYGLSKITANLVFSLDNQKQIEVCENRIARHYLAIEICKYLVCRPSGFLWNYKRPWAYFGKQNSSIDQNRNYVTKVLFYKNFEPG